MTLLGFRNLHICMYIRQQIHDNMGMYNFKARSKSIDIRGRDSMSKVEGLRVHEVGGYYFHSEYIWHRVLVFFMTTSNFGGGGQPPLIKKWGGSSPPAPPPPPQVLCPWTSLSLPSLTKNEVAVVNNVS